MRCIAEEICMRWIVEKIIMSCSPNAETHEIIPCNSWFYTMAAVHGIIP